LHDELDIPVLYVSHSQDELARLADHTVPLDRGRPPPSAPIGETLARRGVPVAGGGEAGGGDRWRGWGSSHTAIWGSAKGGCACCACVAEAPTTAAAEPSKRARALRRSKAAQIMLGPSAQALAAEEPIC
ncbi:hypothetical protein B1218_37630, partial [Pseudomonas ogarae]